MGLQALRLDSRVLIPAINSSYQRPVLLQSKAATTLSGIGMMDETGGEGSDESDARLKGETLAGDEEEEGAQFPDPTIPIAHWADMAISSSKKPDAFSLHSKSSSAPRHRHERSMMSQTKRAVRRVLRGIKKKICWCCEQQVIRTWADIRPDAADELDRSSSASEYSCPGIVTLDDVGMLFNM
jgi:hypothetical protein